MDTQTADLYAGKGLYIAGQWTRGSGERIAVIDPATEHTIGEIPKATPAELTAAVDAAATAFPKWRATNAWERARLLNAIAAHIRANLDRYATIMTREIGKPLAEAKGEFTVAAEQFEWYAGEAQRIYGQTIEGRAPDARLVVLYQPVGPVAAFTPWNFPGFLPARKIAPALAAGCTVVLKPAEETPGSAYAILESIIAAGVPAGVVNLVTGDPDQVSRHLIADTRIRKVSFTGSVPVGKHLMKLAADDVKRVSMELGGHAPVIVFDDADPLFAAEAAARAKFRNAGQVCVSPTRFFVHEKLYDAFADRFVQVAKSLKIGNGFEAGVEMGPVANQRRFDAAAGFVEDAVSKGAKLLTGGGAVPGQNSGFFFAPTVLGNVPDDARIMTEEPFAPVAPLVPFTDIDATIRKANSLPFGLAAYLFTKDLKRATETAEQLEAGMVGVNDLLVSTAEAPFGGVKNSGVGREGGSLGIKDYLEPHYIKYKLV